ncbi:hypothetical protein [Flavobacterium hydatis]|uniref:Lipoprotein n=1 Tax=Flavobacterium hydatis TaxID=991 RepID=A0A086AG17_FLAHY|nr:hypothetical protein [Flavobacterium hydatis]KFF15631.1 hypothetical protein IW20_13225 [Flavobacterium hydatis]OXA86963.1 hypothetical protein B0A62_23175 [Flavobacterium hydatis]
MKKIVTILIVFVLIQSCKSQVGKNLNNHKIEKFNLNEFNNKKVGNDFFETTKDSTSRMMETDDGFYKYSNALNSPYEIRKVYYKKTFNLKIETTYFYSIPIGTYKVYDEDGNVTIEKNLDVYNFSIPELINKMKNDFNIDLLNTYGKGVLIGGENNKSVYLIIILIDAKAPKRGSREIKIDAMNGELISDKILKYEE